MFRQEGNIHMMTRRSAFAALGLAAALLLSPAAALAQAQGDHLTQAIEELKEAIHEGKQQMYSSFAEHTHNAYDHAKAYTGEDPKGHVKSALASMKQAMKVAKRTHHASRLAKGVAHAERALVHLKVAANQ